jgi:hypothetical protein
MATSRSLSVPVLGSIELPSPDRLVFYAGLGVLAAFQVIDWPVALIVGIGHILAEQRRWRAGQDVGEALQTA